MSAILFSSSQWVHSWLFLFSRPTFQWLVYKMSAFVYKLFSERLKMNQFSIVTTFFFFQISHHNSNIQMTFIFCMIAHNLNFVDGTQMWYKTFGLSAACHCFLWVRIWLTSELLAMWSCLVTYPFMPSFL